MPDKATLALEYRVFDGEVRRRAEVFGWPNALRHERQYWIRLYDARDDGPTAIDTYGQNGAFIARTRFLRPAAERFFVLAPALAARLGAGLSVPDRAVLEVCFETEMLFVGDVHSGTHFEAQNPRFTIGSWRGTLVRFDAAHLPGAGGAAGRTGPLADLAASLEASFGEAITDLLTGLPALP
jgi:hypothetical protein